MKKIFQLSTPVQFSSKVSIVELPQRDVYDDMIVKFTGFGQTSFETIGASPVLLKINAKIISAQTCKNQDYWLNYHLLSNQICIKSNVIDPRNSQYGLGGGPCHVSFFSFILKCRVNPPVLGHLSTAIFFCQLL